MHAIVCRRNKNKIRQKNCPQESKTDTWKYTQEGTERWEEAKKKSQASKQKDDDDDDADTEWAAVVVTVKTTKKKKKNYSNFKVHRPLIWLPFNHFIFWQMLLVTQFFFVTDIAAAAAATVFCYICIYSSSNIKMLLVIL